MLFDKLCCDTLLCFDDVKAIRVLSRERPLREFLPPALLAMFGYVRLTAVFDLCRTRYPLPVNAAPRSAF